MSTDSKGDGGRFGEINSVNKMALEIRDTTHYSHYLRTVKLANPTSPFKFHRPKFPLQSGLESDEICFSQTVSITFSFCL